MLLGVAQTQYSRYERGQQDIPLEMLIQLAELYQTTIDYLLGRTNNPLPLPKRKQ